ncbi:FkbM family methyltransferase [Flavobacterium taihuense]|uniref:FkbM family methyltransferase n=1 Tax=Flavobacterium taihuense TaxID=2857508 RepID=A0ABS6XWX7_9FLAO|nr:FkbM family methyltransferase [Flavobacterium taihuense]MBW4360363.1 FkbM family methyltransferase [Flavobacterium taihuense]
MKSLAPIVLFTYNRPRHTQQALDALAQNKEAKDSVLYVFCDGAKENATSEDLLKIEAVRSLIYAENRFKELIIKVQERNKGLANSVIDGVTEVINTHGKVIVLEDDIIVGRYFLEFMNGGLVLYQKEERVYGITGYCFPHKGNVKEGTYFLPIMSSWGYGTWADKWIKINFNGQGLLDVVENKKIKDKLDFGNLHFYQMLKDQVFGKNDSWAVRFYVSMFLNKGVFLFPKISLLKNIGFDGTGVHCGLDLSRKYEGGFENNVNIQIDKKEVLLQRNIIKRFKMSESKAKVKIAIRVKRKLVGLFAPEIIQFIKRKLKVSQNEQEQSLANFPRYTKTTVMLKGCEITIPDSASFIFMSKEIFKEEIYRFKTSNKTPYIVDGGANIGLATIYLKLLYPDSDIVAFEPDPEIYRILDKNIKSFNFTNVKLLQKGLWNDNTTLSFKSEGADAGLISDLDKTISASGTIEVVSLRPYLKKTVDFLKLDIEGAETVVLKDIEEDLGKVQRIFVEYHSFVGQSQSLNEIIEILTKAEFRLYMSIPGNNSLNSPLMGLGNYNNMDFQLNIFGYKEDK